MNGYLLVNKTVGPSSHAVVAKLRRILGIKRIGHAGTLDPFASGLMILGISRDATKHLGVFLGLDKKYEATFVLGGVSDTDDALGNIEFVSKKDITTEQVKKTLPDFTGVILQRPPNFSAIKVGGKRLYKEARAGRPITAPKRKVSVYLFEILTPLEKAPDLSPYAYRIKVHIHCGSGTYIRALARDIGEKLEVGGYTEKLERTAIGPWNLKNSLHFDDFTKETIQTNILPIEQSLQTLQNHKKLQITFSKHPNL